MFRIRSMKMNFFALGIAVCNFITLNSLHAQQSTFQQAPFSLPWPMAALGELTAYVPSQNSIYVFGGYADPLGVMDTILRVDLALETVTILDTHLPIPSDLALAVAFNADDGKVYLFHRKDVYRFDPVDETVSLVANDFLPEIVHDYSIAKYVPSENAIYIFGNRGSAGGNYTLKYVPSTNSVESLGNVMEPSNNTSPAVAYGPSNGAVYLFGGNFSCCAFDLIQRFEPSSEAFLTISTTLPVVTGGACAATVPQQNAIYIVGGYNNSQGMRNVYRFDCGNETLQEASNLPVPLNSHGVEYATLQNRLYVLGGSTGNPGGYGPATNAIYYLSLNAPVFTEVGGALGVNDNSGALGIAWGDYNSDGYPDLYVVNQGGRSNRLYHNDGGVTFADIAGVKGINDMNGGRCAAWGDFDNDGDLDLYLSNNDASGTDPHNRLFRNDGNIFVDVAPQMGVDDPAQGNAAIWGDYDKDGDIDLYLVNVDAPNRLFRNDGSEFTDVAPTMGVDDGGPGPDAHWLDFDNDADLDLYVSNDGQQPSKLYRNDCTQFTDVAPAMGIDHLGYPHDVDWGDYDNDGDQDLYISDGWNIGQNRLYRNDGTQFTDVAPDLGISGNGSSTAVSWGDYDNDGDLDLFVGGGGATSNHLYRNDGSAFADVAQNMKMELPTDDVHGAGWGDFDRDGDLDLYAGVGGPSSSSNRLFKNEGGNNNWLIIKTVGTVSNREGIGAKIKVTAGAIVQYREVNSGGGFSHNSLDTEIGLALASNIDEIEVRWPSGSVQTLTNVSVNQYLTIVEPETPLTVSIDVKPGSAINAINPNSRGNIPVAILTTCTSQGEALDFDATTVDPLSVEFGPTGATESHGRGHIEDVDGDGDLDLVLHFRTQQTGIQCGDIEVSLVGETFSGQAIAGTDSIRTTGCRMAKAVAENQMDVPDGFALDQNYPNPFNPETEILFQLPAANQVLVKIFNTLGEEILTLVDQQLEAGYHNVHWNGKDEHGNPVSSGLYLYQIRAGSFIQTRKMSLLR